MDESLKQRLVGAIVLVALAVIFIPMILDGQRDPTSSMFGQPIPEKPAVLKRLATATPKPIEMPVRPEIVERQLVDQHTPKLKNDVATVKQTTPVPAPVDAVKKNAQTTNKTSNAWVVQVGSFSNRNNAVSLRDKLLKYNYRAFVEAVKTKGTWTYRVRIGPEVRRSSAEATQQALLKKLKINGVVMGHP